MLCFKTGSVATVCVAIFIAYPILFPMFAVGTRGLYLTFWNAKPM